MDNTHCFVFKEKFEDLERIICSYLSKLAEFREITLNLEQKNKFLEIVKQENQTHTSQIGDSSEEKRFRGYAIVQSSGGYINVFPLHNRVDIDNDFSNELIEISKECQNPVFYSWNDHSTWGNAGFVSGKIVKTISFSTHELRCDIDGKKLKLGFLGNGRYPEVKSLLPVEFHDYLNHELAQEQLFEECRVIMYLDKNIADINAFFEKAEARLAESKKNKPFETVFSLLFIFIVFGIICIAFRFAPIISFVGLGILIFVFRDKKKKV